MTMKWYRILSIPVALILLLAVTAVPTVACQPGTPCTSLQKVEGKPSLGSPVELTGTDKTKVMNTAMANGKVNELKDRYVKEGYTLKDTKSYVVPITYEDGSSLEVQITTIEFQSSDGNTSQINYAYSPKTGESIVTVSSMGAISCAVCPAAILVGGLGCAAVCISPAGLLTMEALCIACICAAAVIALCPCYDCCILLGNEKCREVSEFIGC